METTRTHSIYAIYCQDTGEVYIGRSKNPKARFKQHLSNIGCPVYERAMKYGKDHLYMLVLRNGIPENLIASYEAKYIYEFYFQVPLMNRVMPSYTNLAHFCTNEGETDFYCELVDSIEKDLNGESPRVHMTVKKNTFNQYYAADDLRRIALKTRRTI